MVCLLDKAVLLIFVGFATGCSIGTGRFDTSARHDLEIGRTTPERAVELLGEPSSVVAEEADEHDAALLWYYEELEIPFPFGPQRYRRLTLEFVNGVLNGFGYWSSFEGELNALEEERLERIEPERARGFHVIDVLGEPRGIAACPTKLEECEDGEVWLYQFSNGDVKVFFGTDEVVKRFDVWVIRGDHDPFENGLPFPPGDWLKIGQASKEDVVGFLGPPSAERWGTKRRRELTYSSASFELVLRLDLRQLTVEIQEGTVQAYRFMSSVDGDLSLVPLPGALKRGMTIAEVQPLMGIPHAQIVCPSGLVERCDEGTVWEWKRRFPLTGFDQQNDQGSEVRDLRLRFNRDGILVQIERK